MKVNPNSEIQEIFACGIRNPAWALNPEYIQLMESRIPPTIGIRNASSIVKHPKSTQPFIPETMADLDYLIWGEDNRIANEK